MVGRSGNASVVNGPLAERIARASSAFSDSQRRAADFLVQKPFDAATMTIDAFAGAAGISIATANRFARALGFAGYADFRAGLVEAVRPAAPEQKLRAAGSRNASAGDIMAASLRQDVANLDRTAAALAARAEAAAAMLSAGERIFTVGFGTSGYLASYAANLLDPVCADARFVAVEGGTEQAARRLLKLEPGHVVVAITFPRYSKDIVAMVRLAKARGARVLAITDAPTSPIAALADLALYASAERQILSSSAVAGVALIEALASAVAWQCKDAVETMAALTGQVEPYLHDGADVPARRRSRKSRARKGGT
jgi:DNA-binding MurR/RpiR family transcriptional regulator